MFNFCCFPAVSGMVYAHQPWHLQERNRSLMPMGVFTLLVCTCVTWSIINSLTLVSCLPSASCPNPWILFFPAQIYYSGSKGVPPKSLSPPPVLFLLKLIDTFNISEPLDRPFWEKCKEPRGRENNAIQIVLAFNMLQHMNHQHMIKGHGNYTV